MQLLMLYKNPSYPKLLRKSVPLLVRDFTPSIYGLFSFE